MPGHIIKRFYNLQVDFNKRPQYTRAKLSRCARANHFKSRSQTEKTTSPVYKRATSFRYCTYVENWLYVCRHGWGGSFLCRHVTRSGFLWCGVPILQVFCGLFWTYMHVAELWHMHSRLQTNSYLKQLHGENAKSFLISQSTNRKWHCWSLKEVLQSEFSY